MWSKAWRLGRAAGLSTWGRTLECPWPPGRRGTKKKLLQLSKLDVNTAKTSTTDGANVVAREFVPSLFDVYKDEASQTVNVGTLLQEIERSGIRRTDPRLEDLNVGIEKAHREEGTPGTICENFNMDKKTFQRLMEENIIILTQIFKKQLVVPEFEEFARHVESIFTRCQHNRSGKVASYIPQLARSSPDSWACSVCTVDGQRMSFGDVNSKFTLQSCSKPFIYSICLNELGANLVHQYVSHEPSGRNFNEICLDSRNKPHNPMLNSGAIMIAAVTLGLLKPDISLAEKFDYMKNYLERIAGNHGIGFNNSVYLSERESADRNFAMAYYMKEHKCFPKVFNLRECMDLYFQVDTEALSVMGATFANGGICPITGSKVIQPDCVRDVLSLMYSCGMYNYSGQFAFEVGLPAKSGVSGCMVLVVPNLMSIALWSPPLDEIGNSARGLQFSEELVELFNFHRFDNLRHSERKLDPRKRKNERETVSTMTLLFATMSGDITALKRHFLLGLSMEQGDYDGRTALHLAAAEGHYECVKFLVDVAQVSINPTDRWGFTPLEEAKRFNKLKVADYLENQMAARTDNGTD